MLRSLFDAGYGDDGFRTCGVTGLRIHRTVENLVKVFGLTAVVALIIGGIAAIAVALTRWELVGLLGPEAFYRYLSLHAWNLLVFWMVFMEIAILYVGGAMVLGRKLALPSLAKGGWVLMFGAAVTVNVAIWITDPPMTQQPLLTSYVPLRSHPLFYAGAALFLLGATVAALPFFATIWKEKREKPGKALPLITFGAFATSIIAFEALVGGLATYVPTFLWSVGLMESIDGEWYRQMYWTIGHGSQQINLAAMVTVWYFMTYLVGGAEVVSEKVSRTAFILYVFFINLGAAHHILADPGVTAEWRLWNTSYAMYGAVAASMIHAFAIPAGLEAGLRKKGIGGDSWFGWLKEAPWSDPGFSSTVFSIFLFGFLGGISGVLVGQMQLNIMRHNTLAIPGHFHATVAVGTTLAFMGLLYWVLRLNFLKEWVGEKLARIQPYLYAGAMSLAIMAMMIVGILYSVPRRHPSVMQFPGTDFNMAEAGPMLAVFGVTALVAIVAGAIFVFVALASLLFGERAEPSLPFPLESREDGGGETHLGSLRGSFALCILFLISFGVLYFLDWAWLGAIWQFGT
ncbi:MAG: cbb3-type cytochrome c oxidase subunit I [Longimicrobiales bacterium]|nr:cbb3-type cytochrome c oxidase subunit I [Longimicrobiales bacterium]